MTDTIRKLDLESARYSKLISTLPQGVDTIGIQLTDSDLLLVLMRSLPEAVKTFAVHRSRGDSYQAYRESARRWEQQQRLFVEHMTSQNSSHSKNKIVNEVSHDGWQSEAQGDSSGTQWYSLEDDWSSESWHVDAVSSSTSVKCQRCGSRKHATESCQLICLAPSVFVVTKWDMWGLIAQRIVKVRVSLVIPLTKVKERVLLTKERMVRAKDPSRIKAGRVSERRANSTNLRWPVMTGGGMMMVGAALMMIGLGM